MKTTLPIHERFHAFQGEGEHMGRSAFFIRTFGCPVHCPWCDSAGTWHKDWIPDHVERLEVSQLREEIEEASPSFVVLTGGEPTVHDLSPLLEVLQPEWMIHIETCGGFDDPNDPEDFDWITLSPKWNKLPTQRWLEEAHELKLIIEDDSSVVAWLGKLEEILGKKDFDHLMDSTPIWLHPEWSKRKDPSVLKTISNSVKTIGGNIRAGYQLHKLYQVDSLDDRTKPLAPLGGDASKYGY